MELSQNLVAELSTTENIDSLKQKIDRLNQEAWDTRVYDSPTSFKLSTESVGLARSINYDKGLAHALKTLAFCFVRVAKNEEALPLLEEALPLMKSFHDVRGEAVVLSYISVVKRNQGDFETSLKLAFKALELSHDAGFRENEGTDLYQIGVTYKHLGNVEKALEYLYRSLSLFGEDDNKLFQSYPVNVIGAIYFEGGDYEKALEYFEKGLLTRQASLDKLGEAGSLDNIGLAHFRMGNIRKAIDYCQESIAVAETTGDKRALSNALLHLAEIYKQEGEIERATELSNKSLELKKAIGDRWREVEMILFLADLNKVVGDNKQVVELLGQARQVAQELNMQDLLSRSHFQFSEYYKEQGNFEEALEHLTLHINLEKEFHKNSVERKIQNLEITNKAEETRKEADAMKSKNDELTRLNQEIRRQKKELEEMLNNLKATQQQLIHSEKMASLGELTAGIAHEIQNPLNFVNNFSEVNTDMIEEAADAIDKGNYDDAKSILSDIRANSKKINHHGKRADSIVKNMLEHSRSGSGERQPTDMNVLCDEYLRLAYHGMRAKDKSLNVDLKTELDESIGKINIVPQDIGRVLLNLFNNAFYAVSERVKLDGENFKAEVSVQTKKVDNQIEVKVEDNGNGIPESIREKIFQPFFTTKPTGHGTGLGLSLSYDIIKAHGGDIRVETGNNSGTTITIKLPG